MLHHLKIDKSFKHHLLSVWLLFLCISTSFSQNEADSFAYLNIDTVTIAASQNELCYTTFTSSPFHKGSLRYNVSTDTFVNFPLCIKVNNEKNIPMRIDSVIWKINELHSDDSFVFNIFYNGKLYQSCVSNRRKSRKNQVVFTFDKNLFFPQGISYFSFAIKNSQFLSVATNYKTKGYEYSFNKEENIFTLSNNPSLMNMGVPQIKLFYSLVN